jgi:hypothetical protein
MHSSANAAEYGLTPLMVHKNAYQTLGNYFQIGQVLPRVYCALITSQLLPRQCVLLHRTEWSVGVQLQPEQHTVPHLHHSPATIQGTGPVPRPLITDD